MKRLFTLTLVMIMMSLVIVSAQQEEIRFRHPLGTNLTIFEKCRVNGAICDNTYVCNLTILSPSQTLVVDTETMTDLGVYQQFNLTEDQTEPNGEYEATVDCTNTTLSGSNTFFYEITPNGSAPVTQGQGLVLLGSVFLLIIVALFVGFLGFRSNNTTIQLSFIAFSIILSVFTLGLIVNVIQLSFGTFSEIVGNFSTVYTLFTVLLGIGAIGLIIYIIIVALNYYWALRGMKDTISIQGL